jgi:ribosomal protein S18 acetylase RimI-like enzyme
MIRLRVLKAEDLVDVLRIQGECYTDIEPESPDSLRGKILASPGTSFIAKSVEGVIGYLISVPIVYPQLPPLNSSVFTRPTHSDTLYIHDVAVSRCGRGTGVAQAMVRESMKAAKDQGVSQACLVAIQNSHHFWEQFGFNIAVTSDVRAAKALSSYGSGAKLMHAWI